MMEGLETSKSDYHGFLEMQLSGQSFETDRVFSRVLGPLKHVATEPFRELRQGQGAVGASSVTWTRT